MLTSFFTLPNFVSEYTVLFALNKIVFGYKHKHLHQMYQEVWEMASGPILMKGKLHLLAE